MPKTGRSTARIGVGRQLLGLRQGSFLYGEEPTPNPVPRGTATPVLTTPEGASWCHAKRGGHSGCSSREKLREEKSRSQSRGYKPRGPVNRVCVECGKVFLGRPAEEAHLLKALHRRPLSAAASVQGSGGGGSQAAAAAEAEARAAQSLGLRPRSFSTSRWPFAERPQQGSRLTLSGRPTDFAETASLELTGVSDETLASTSRLTVLVLMHCRPSRSAGAAGCPITTPSSRRAPRPRSLSCGTSVPTRTHKEQTRDRESGRQQ
jgi:hypothetical protein